MLTLRDSIGPRSPDALQRCIAKLPEAGLISICVPTYRRPSLLLHALHSCLIQDYRPLEIDIGDDSPGDDSERLVSGLTLPAGVTLRYHRNRPGVGQAANVNALFAAARGARLMLLHDDDVLLPGAIGALDAAFNATPGVVAAYGRQQIIGESGEVSCADTAFHNAHSNRTAEHAGIRRDLLVCALWRQFPNNGYLIHSATARTVGYRSFAEIGDPCDTDFSIRLALAARGRAFAFIDRTTSQYRMSWTGLNQSDNVSWKFFDYVASLPGLAPAQSTARDALLAKIAAKATVENALQRRRHVALRIFCSRFYPRRQHGWLKSAYHLGVIAAPRIAALRRFAPPPQLATPS